MKLPIAHLCFTNALHDMTLFFARLRHPNSGLDHQYFSLFHAAFRPVNSMFVFTPSTISPTILFFEYC